MRKIRLIIKREYLTRVRKRSFIIMTLLGPVLMAGLFIVPVYLAQLEGETKTIGIIDDTGLFADKFTDTENLKFLVLHQNLDSVKANLSVMKIYAVLYIPKTELSVPQSAVLYSEHQPNIMVTGAIRSTIRSEVEALKLSASGINPDILRGIKTSINLQTVRIAEGSEEKNSSTELSMAVGYASSFLIYIFIFMYGALVMRSVIEEKTSRIVEVIISSVKPFQLMMGKITGVVLVGLTQFVLWIFLTLAIITAFLSAYSTDISTYKSSQLKIEQQLTSHPETGTQELIQRGNTGTKDEVNEAVISIFDSIQSINFTLIIFMFLFYFIGGYLLYGSLFAAIGSAVDSETDTQQFMLPLTVPLILSLVIAQFIMVNPDGPAAFWLSIFPLTSPVIMMIRLPFGVPIFQVVLSVVLMVLGFLGSTWLAAKIYRTGILMYGKKITYRELWKWIKYRN